MKKTVKIIVYIILICFAYLCLSISPIFFLDFPKKIDHKKFKVIGHRGASELAPENTIASINLALKLNPDRIEIDVQQTLDSVIILMHDITLDRTSNGTGLIKEKTFQEISKLDAGGWFSNDFSEEKIPTLENILELVNGKCKLIIEIKKGNDYYPNIEKNVLEVIKKQRAEKWVIIHSFDYKILERVHELNSNISLQKLFVGKFKFVPFMFSNKIERLDLENYPYIEEYGLNYIFANRKIISFLKSKGKKVNVWTVNNFDI